MKDRSPHEKLLHVARFLELAIGIVILVVIVCGAMELIYETGKTLVSSPESFVIEDFLTSSLLLVMGIEFVKMLALHSAESVVDVLLFTIVRQMIVNHGDAAETLLGVASVAAIFAVKKFLQNKEVDAE